MEPSSRSVLKRSLLSFVAASSVLWMIGTSTVVAGANEAREVSRLDRIPADVQSQYGRILDPEVDHLNGQIVLAPWDRLLLQVFQLKAEDSPMSLLVRAYDLDSMALRSSFEVPASLSSSDIGLFVSSDPGGHRVFLGDIRNASGALGFVTIDTKALSGNVVAYPTGVNKIYKTGLSYDARTDRLYSVTVSTCVGASGCPGAATVLTAMSPSDGSIVFRKPLRACRGTVPDEFSDTNDPTLPIVSMPGPDGSSRLHVACWLRQEVSGVVIVSDRESETSEKFVLGPAQIFTMLADHGSGRIVFIGQPGSSGSEEGFVYDAKSSAFVGAMVLARSTARTGYGLDQSTGVMFGLSSSLGLFSSQIRLDPIPQPELYRGFPQLMSYSRIWYDHATSRVFVLPDLPETESTFKKDAHYRVVKVPVPLPVPPPVDPDRNTSNVFEGESTRASFAANGSAYGMRVLFARGIQGAVPGTGDSLNPVPLLSIEYAPNKCGFVDRMFTFGMIGASQGPASLTDTGASARAAEVETDDATKVDLATPSRCDQPILPRQGLGYFDRGVFSDPAVVNSGLPDWLDSNVGKPWAYSPAECSGDDGSRSATSNQGTDLGDATVTCGSAKESLVATSSSRVDLGEVSAAFTTSTVTMSRVEGVGTKVVAKSLARGVQIGAVSIGEVKTEAVSTSGGRKGTATATFTRQISGLLLPGDARPHSCVNKGCEDLLARLNDAFAGRAEFRFPSPDEVICRNLNNDGGCVGTPGGAQAGIIKSEFRRASDKAMSGDSSREIPGLEILIYNDNQWTGRARELFQIAGVQATTSYNISALQTGVGFDPFVESSFDEGGETFLTLPEFTEPPVAETPIRRFLRKIFKPILEGVRLLLANPREAARAATVWVLLAAPVIMAVRWRRLVSLSQST